MAGSRRSSSRKRRHTQHGEIVSLVLDCASVVGFVLLAILFGGANAGGFAGTATVQLVAAIVIAAAIFRFDPRGLVPAERSLWLLAAALLVLMLVQLIPLPPGLWSALPGRARTVETLTALGITPLPWMPLSLAPDQTFRSVLAMLPPIAALVLVVRASRTASQAGLWALFAVAAVSVLIGLAQLSGGVDSPFYFYAITNRGSAVGFFSNANHFSTLMLIVLPLAAGVAARARSRGENKNLVTVTWICAAGVTFLALLGLLIGGSLAGLLLAPPAMFAAFLIFRASLSRRARLWLIIGLLLVVAAAIAVVVFSPAVTDLGASNFGGAGMSRKYLWGVAGEATRSSFPFGSGFGTLEEVFRQYENPATVGPIYANHAHSDLIELVLEGGVASALLLLLFLGWVARRTWVLWTAEREARDPVARGAAVSVILVLLHSLVDYPLRTAAVAVPFAFCCALMARPPRAVAEAQAEAAKAPTARHLAA